MRVTRVRQFQWEIDDCQDLIRLKLCSPDDVAVQCDENASPERLGGLTNSNYLVTVGGCRKVLRLPGLGTEAIIDRTLEPRLMSLIADTDISPKTTFYGNAGIKLADHLDGYENIENREVTDTILEGVARRLRRLHDVPRRELQGMKPEDLSVVAYMTLYERQTGMKLLDDEEREEMLSFADAMDRDRQVLCHRDLMLGNIMTCGGDVKLIDFEYASFCSAYWDIGSFLTETRLDEERTKVFMDLYGGLDPIRVRQARILVDYVWALWGFVKGYVSYGRKRLVEMQRAWETYENLRK